MVDMQMAATRLQPGSESDVVLGPCPGCESWQLDYSKDVVSALGVASFYEAVEGILQDHLVECPHLQQLLLRGWL